MSMNIVKSIEDLKLTHIMMMVYGQPGVRKTSICSSAEAPLLLNFESTQNALKAYGRPDSVHIVAQRAGEQQTTWEDLRKLSKRELAPYKTLVIDTAGRLVDCVGAYVEGRLGIPASSTFRYYGEIKTQAIGFFTTINQLGLDIVFVAHEKSEEIRKKTLLSPMIAGGSGGEIYRDCVAIGYLSAASRGRYHLDFEPDDNRVAKNCGLPDYDVPSLEQDPDFLAGVIWKIKENLLSSVAEKDEIALFRKRVFAANLDKQIHALISEINNSKKFSKRSVNVIKKMIASQAGNLGLVWDENIAAYTKPENDGSSEFRAEMEAAEAEMEVAEETVNSADEA